MKNNQLDNDSNWISGGDLKVSSSNNSIIIGCDSIVINDKQVLIPYKVKQSIYNCSSIVSNKVYINGYEYKEKTNEWKKTLKALYHLYF